MLSVPLRETIRWSMTWSSAAGRSGQGWRGQVDVVITGEAAAGWVVMDQQQPRCAQLQRAMDDLAREEGRFIDGATPERFSTMIYWPPSTKHRPELFDMLMGELRLEVRHKDIQGRQPPARHQRLGRDGANERARQGKRPLHPVRRRSCARPRCSSRHCRANRRPRSVVPTCHEAQQWRTRKETSKARQPPGAVAPPPGPYRSQVSSNMIG